jgi:hypothetical protein
LLRVAGAVILFVSSFSFAYFLTTTTESMNKFGFMQDRQSCLIVSISAGLIGFALVFVGLPEDKGNSAK